MKATTFYILCFVTFIVSTAHSQINNPPPVNGWSFYRYLGSGPAVTYSRLSDTSYKGSHSQAFYVSFPGAGQKIEWVKNLGREYAKPTHINYKYAYVNGGWSPTINLQIRFYMKDGDSLYYSDYSTVYKESGWVLSSRASCLGSVPNFSEIVIDFCFMPPLITPISASAEVLIDELQLRYGNDSTITIDRFGDPVTKIFDSHVMSNQFRLYQNYPNPFNPNTTISFSLPVRSFVSLKIFDMVGREAAALVAEELPAGNHSKQWNAANMPSGIYFYRLQVGLFTETKKLVLLK